MSGQDHRTTQYQIPYTLIILTDHTVHSQLFKSSINVIIIIIIINHIISACPTLAKEKYIKRHDRVCAQLHFNVCKETGVKLDTNHWHEHVPKSVETGQGGNVTVLWNQQVQTDRTIPNNKPDIITRDNEKRTCMLIDVAISGDRNVIKREAEKVLKYKDLTIKIQRMWNVKTKVIPVIIGATGTISKSFRKYVSNIPGNHELRNYRKQPYWALHTYFGKC